MPPTPHPSFHCSRAFLAARACPTAEQGVLTPFRSCLKVWPAKLIVPECNEWHCHLPTLDMVIRLPTGTFEVRALATSRLGAQIIECRNAITLQFRPEERFTQTMLMLQNFVNSKVSLLIGEGHGEPPRRLLEMAQREPQSSDLIQQLLRSLTPTNGPLHAPLQHSHASSAASTCTSISALSSVGTATHAAGAPSWPTATATTTTIARPESAPTLGKTPVHSASASGLGAMPRAALRTRPVSAAAQLKSEVAHTAAGYCVRPSAALSYVMASRDALTTHAEHVHVGRTTQAYAEMQGVEADVPLFVTKPPRATSASSPAGRVATATANVVVAHASRGTSSAVELVPRVVDDDVMIEIADGLDGLAWHKGAGSSLAAQAAQAVLPRTKTVKRVSGKPFSNYQKYEAKKNALVGHTVHVTSVGPYVSKLEQMGIDEQKKRAKSLHTEVFKPGGLWDKWEPPPGGWGFAAAGFLLPDDLPATAKRFGSFYNTHAHNFRWTEPKKNLYM